MGDRWAIHIDVEGFGAKWDDTMEAFRGLNALMQAIFWLGERAYPEPPERLFAHQFGDGFLIVSDFHEETLHRAVLISIALLQHVLSQGATAKAAIAEGGLSDVQGCYPPEIGRQSNKGNIIFGAGVMTVFPVMGTALINAVALEKRSPSGPLLTVAASNLDRLPGDVSTIKIGESLVAINWLRSGPTGLCDLQKAAGLKSHSEQERIKQLRDYIAANEGLKDQWKENATRYLLSNGI
jgi:hypothetical protein